jgi:hypothetical protein
VKAVSDEGWYAAEIKALASRKWAKAFTEQFAMMRRSAPPIDD